MVAQRHQRGPHLRRPGQPRLRQARVAPDQRFSTGGWVAGQRPRLQQGRRGRLWPMWPSIARGQHGGRAEPRASAWAARSRSTGAPQRQASTLKLRRSLHAVPDGLALEPSDRLLHGPGRHRSPPTANANKHGHQVHVRSNTRAAWPPTTPSATAAARRQAPTSSPINADWTRRARTRTITTSTSRIRSATDMAATACRSIVHRLAQHWPAPRPSACSPASRRWPIRTSTRPRTSARACACTSLRRVAAAASPTTCLAGQTRRQAATSTATLKDDQAGRDGRRSRKKNTKARMTSPASAAAAVATAATWPRCRPTLTQRVQQPAASWAAQPEPVAVLRS
jgi:hypothetical protein